MIYITLKIMNEITDYKRTGNLPAFNKVMDLLEELKLHPKTGTGKPEQLKYKSGNIWSRRINKEHRLIYSICDDKVIVAVISAKGHYE
jgi:toxin YoeB